MLLYTDQDVLSKRNIRINVAVLRKGSKLKMNYCWNCYNALVENINYFGVNLNSYDIFHKTRSVLALRM